MLVSEACILNDSSDMPGWLCLYIFLYRIYFIQNEPYYQRLLKFMCLRGRK